MICIFLADGFEDIEAVVTRDILKRGKVDVVTVSLGGDIVTSAYGLRVTVDMRLSELVCSDIQGIVLPGGMQGTNNLENSEKLVEIIKYCNENNLLIGAICAAPSILGKLGLLQGKAACCYTGFEQYLKGATVSAEQVIVDGNIVTSKGPGTAVNFGFELLRYLKGKDYADKVKKGMLCET